MKVRLTVAALAATTLLGLTACQPEPIAPSPAPTVETTSAAPSPTPTGTPTPSFAPDEQAAIAEAEAAYRAWFALLDRIYKAPKQYSLEKVRQELHKVGGDPAAQETILDFDNVKRGGLAQKGNLLLAWAKPRSVNLVTTSGSYPEVVFEACTDSSNVQLVFESTGKPAGSPPAETRFLRDIKVWFYAKAWHVVQDSTKRAVKKC